MFERDCVDGGERGAAGDPGGRRGGGPLYPPPDPRHCPCSNQKEKNATKQGLQKP